MDGRHALTPYIYIRQPPLPHLQRLLLYRQLGNATLTEGDAGVHQRTGVATGTLGRTLDGAEIHDGLVIVSGVGGRQQTLCQGRELMLALGGVDGGDDAVMTAEHAVDITVDDGGRQSEGHGADGGGGIVANALEAAQSFDGGGEASGSHNLTGSSVEVAGAAVVA